MFTHFVTLLEKLENLMKKGNKIIKTIYKNLKKYVIDSEKCTLYLYAQ